MKSFQRVTTVIALTLLASHQAVAAPASENQARSDSQPAVSPSPSGNVAISTIGTVGNEIGVPPNTVVISNDGTVHVVPDGTTAVVWNSPTGGDFAKNITNNVDNQIAAAFGNIPNAVNALTGGDLAESITKNVDNQIAAAFASAADA